MMDIQVVCNLNVARSPFLCAFLSMHFPDVNFTSSGINAIPVSETSLFAVQLANDWGFQLAAKQSSKTTPNLKTKYLPVERSIANALSSLDADLPLLNDSINPSTYSVRMPVDPINLPRNAFAYELALLLNYGAKIVLNEFPRSDLREITVMEFSGEDFEIANLLQYVNRRQGDIYIVNASLRNLQIHDFISEFFTVSPLLEKSFSSVAYSSKFELLEPEKLLCSVEWRQWLYQLAQTKQVLLLVAPRSKSEQMMIPETILATIWAGEFAVD
jgi:hypothetical protein